MDVQPLLVPTLAEHGISQRAGLIVTMDRGTSGSGKHGRLLRERTAWIVAAID